MAKKRANGEGSIRKKPSGRWEGRYTQGIDPVTGRAIQKSVSAKTQAECKEKLAKAIRENRGVPLNHTGDYTAAEWCRLWFETYSKPNIRYNTAKGYEGIIEHHIIPAIGTIKLKQLSSIHIQRMYNDLKENGRMQRGSKQNDKPLSNTFVRRVHAVLQAALKQAVKERLIPYNPCENCRIPPKDKKEMTILPPERIGRYLQEAEKYGGEQQRVAIARALAAGSRVILADEPTGSLDSDNGRMIVETLQRLAHQEERCVIVVTHDPKVAEAADIRLHMQDGKLSGEEA